jgi:hypothetical protein
MTLGDLARRFAEEENLSFKASMGLAQLVVRAYQGGFEDGAKAAVVDGPTQVPEPQDALATEGWDP